MRNGLSNIHLQTGRPSKRLFGSRPIVFFKAYHNDLAGGYVTALAGKNFHFSVQFRIGGLLDFDGLARFMVVFYPQASNQDKYDLHSHHVVYSPWQFR